MPTEPTSLSEFLDTMPEFWGLGLSWHWYVGGFVAFWAWFFYTRRKRK